MSTKHDNVTKLHFAGPLYVILSVTGYNHMRAAPRRDPGSLAQEPATLPNFPTMPMGQPTFYELVKPCEINS